MPACSAGMFYLNTQFSTLLSYLIVSTVFKALFSKHCNNKLSLASDLKLTIGWQAVIKTIQTVLIISLLTLTTSGYAQEEKERLQK